jgi:hypothetical protein
MLLSSIHRDAASPSVPSACLTAHPLLVSFRFSIVLHGVHWSRRFLRSSVFPDIVALPGRLPAHQQAHRQSAHSHQPTIQNP